MMLKLTYLSRVFKNTSLVINEILCVTACKRPWKLLTILEILSIIRLIVPLHPIQPIFKLRDPST